MLCEPPSHAKIIPHLEPALLGLAEKNEELRLSPPQPSGCGSPDCLLDYRPRQSRLRKKEAFTIYKRWLLRPSRVLGIKQYFIMSSPVSERLSCSGEWGERPHFANCIVAVAQASSSRPRYFNMLTTAHAHSGIWMLLYASRNLHIRSQEDWPVVWLSFVLQVHLSDGVHFNPKVRSHISQLYLNSSIFATTQL